MLLIMGKDYQTSKKSQHYHQLFFIYFLRSIYRPRRAGRGKREIEVKKREVYFGYIYTSQFTQPWFLADCPRLLMSHVGISTYDSEVLILVWDPSPSDGRIRVTFDVGTRYQNHRKTQAFDDLFFIYFCAVYTGLPARGAENPICRFSIHWVGAWLFKKIMLYCKGDDP